MRYTNDIDLKKAWKHFLASPYENWVVLLDYDEIERQRLWAARVDEPDKDLTLPKVGSPEHKALSNAAALFRELVELDRRRAVENGITVEAPNNNGDWRMYSVGPLGTFCVADRTSGPEYFCTAYRLEHHCPVTKRSTRLHFVARGLDRLRSLIRAAQAELSATPARDVLTDEDMVRLRSYMANRLYGAAVPDGKYDRILTALFDGDSEEAKRRIGLADRNEKTNLLRGHDRP